MAALRDRWNEQAKGLHAGGVPILTHGLKVSPWTTPALARDMQLAELLKLTNENIALVFRVPLQILGIASAPFSSTQALMQFWLASGLGFCLNHIEQAFDKLFGLAGEPADYCEFNTAALLRSDQKDRIEGLARAVMSGIMSPNEARSQEGFNHVPLVTNRERSSKTFRCPPPDQFRRHRDRKRRQPHRQRQGTTKPPCGATSTR